MECGINMKFVFIREVSDEICIQKCKCASEEFVEKNGKCEDKKKKAGKNLMKIVRSLSYFQNFKIFENLKISLFY